MAKYDVKFSCGHEERVELFGKNAERERKIKYFEEYGTCTECYKKEKMERIKRENEEAQKESEMMKLPELTGSEKQIAWATTLRLNWIQEAQEELKEKEDVFKEKKEKNPERVEKYERILKYIENNINKIIKEKTTASFWINNRHSSGRSFVISTVREWFEKEKEKEGKEQC